MDNLMPIGSRTWAFQRTHYWTPKIQDGWDPPSWKSTWRQFFYRGWSDLDKIRRLVQNNMSTAVIWSKLKPNVEFQYGGRLGMSSQSHLPHCGVLLAGEFNVMIPVLPVTLQGAAIWWIHCRDSRATCHIAGCSHLSKSMLWSCHIAGCKNPTAILKIVFRHIIFLLFVNAVWALMSGGFRIVSDTLVMITAAIAKAGIVFNLPVCLCGWTCV